MTDNPYSPPAEAVSNPPPAPGAVHWFSPRQVGVCTFFGGPIAGTLLMWLNARAARQQQRREILLGLAVTAAILVIAMVLPSNRSMFLGIVGAVSMHSLAKFQWASYVSQQPRPLPRRGWIQLGVVLGAMVATLLLALFYGLVMAVVAPDLIPE